MNIFTTLAQYSSQSEYYSSNQLSPEAEATLFVGLSIFYVLLFAIIYVVNGIFLGRIFKKAGLAQWPAWVPFYNNWKFLQIGGQQGAWSLLMYIPFINLVGLVFHYIASYHIGLKLQKEGVFVLVAIFLNIVWLIWLAVDSSKWDDSLSTAPSLATGPKPKTAA